MIFNNINTNLAQDCFRSLEEGKWEIGLFSDNPNLENENSDFFKDHEVKEMNVKKRCLRNKVNVVLMNGSSKTAHIIHWHPSNGYFCITNDTFWDQFQD